MTVLLSASNYCSWWWRIALPKAGATASLRVPQHKSQVLLQSQLGLGQDYCSPGFTAVSYAARVESFSTIENNPST